jgi:plasmid stabilization system protein ParE
MFAVRWKKVARENLAEIWLQAADRNAVTRATHRIDQLLRSNPEQKGESRDGGRRVLLEPPLGVVFRVRTQGQIVEVLRVWQFE